MGVGEWVRSGGRGIQPVIHKNSELTQLSNKQNSCHQLRGRQAGRTGRPAGHSQAVLDEGQHDGGGLHRVLERKEQVHRHAAAQRARQRVLRAYSDDVIGPLYEQTYAEAIEMRGKRREATGKRS